MTEIAPHAVRDHTGAWHPCDLVILCQGAVFTGVVGRYLGALARDGVRRVRLQMMQPAPMPGRLSTAVADGDSLRYYPAYDLPGRGQLPAQAPAAARQARTPRPPAERVRAEPAGSHPERCPRFHGKRR